ncbi:ORFC4 [Zebra finch circovirus]|uniref:ORFC4 n=1 Tax=Zebra finch circovirus TaxID=1642515 RepID=A0A142LXV6_9CIRC|nr:ORFC4 [Zebra finch circovirus]
MADHHVLPWSAFGRPGTLTGQLRGCEAWPTRRSNLAGGGKGRFAAGTALRAVESRVGNSSIVNRVLLHCIGCINKPEHIPHQPLVDASEQCLQIALLFAVPMVGMGIARDDDLL